MVVCQAVRETAGTYFSIVHALPNCNVYGKDLFGKKSNPNI